MRRLVTLLVAGLLLGACGASVDEATDSGADAAGAVATSPTTAPDEGATAGQDAAESSAMVPFGVVETVDGGTVDGADYAGKNLALWFWAPW